jgi:aspartyl-tRNA(Asn)/glutamyl-tRNA(Gln) amidotransferase subunit B
MLEQARAALPELPAARAERYARDFALSVDDARMFAFRAELGDWLEEAVQAGRPAGTEPRAIANWVRGELVARIGADADPARSRVTPQALADLVGLVQTKRVNASAGKHVLDVLVAEGGSPELIVARKNLGAMEADGELVGVIDRVLEAHPEVAERIRGGNPKAIGALVGPIMRETKGRATAAKCSASSARSSG